MRGKLDSYPIGDVLAQTEKLVNSGVKEILVVSQDTGAYGSDKNMSRDFTMDAQS